MLSNWDGRLPPPSNEADRGHTKAFVGMAITSPSPSPTEVPIETPLSHRAMIEICACQFGHRSNISQLQLKAIQSPGSAKQSRDSFHNCDRFFLKSMDLSEKRYGPHGYCSDLPEISLEPLL